MNLVLKLQEIEGRMLGWPGNVSDWAGDMDSDVAFHFLENELRDVLNQISHLSTRERDEYQEILATFHQRMQAHYSETERALRQLEENVNNSVRYVRAAQAYGMQK